MGLSDIKDYIIIGVIVVILGGGAFFGLAQNNEDSDVTVGFVATEGVPDAIGAGTYHKYDTVVLTASVSFGWIFDGWYGSDGKLVSEDVTITFVVTGDSTFTTKSHKGYGVALYGDHGVYELEGSGSYEKNKNAEITVTVATGYKFVGWYDVDNNKISDRTTITLTDHKNTTLIAKTNSTKSYSGSNQTTFSSSADYDLDTVDIVVRDRFSNDYIYSVSGKKDCQLNLKPGIYNCTIKGYLNDGKWYQSVETVVVGTEFDCDYEWYYKGTKYTLDFKVTYSEYKGYCNLNSGGRAPQTDNNRLKLVDYDSEFVKDLAGQLYGLSYKMTGDDRANFVLKFVQLCTTYETDIHRYNQTEHWKYPMETIFERSGDCEDTSILYSALMKALGYDTCLLLYIDGYGDRGHAASGVEMSESYSGTYYETGGIKYFFCETTSDTKNVGQPSEGYDEAHILVVP